MLPAFRANEARSFIAGGLQDFSISREGLTWGIPIPWDPDQVAYVWADALVNYLSALTYARPGEDLIPRYWPAVRHLLAKDILRFHCVYWPAMLLAAGLRRAAPALRPRLSPPRRPQDLEVARKRRRPARARRRLRRRSGPLLVRRSVSFGQDGTASVEGVRERYERELGNDLGNLLSRTTAMVARYRGGELRAVPSPASDVAAIMAPLGADVAARLDAFDLTGALERIWEVVRALNRHVQATAPWQLAKDDARADELDRVLYDLVDGVRAIAVALASYLPETSARILDALGQPPTLDWAEVAYGRARAVEGLRPAEPLFPRIDAPTLAA